MSIPKSIYVGELEICGITLRCHVLDNGQRVLEQKGVEDLFAEWATGHLLDDEDAEAIARFVRGETA